MPTTSASTTLDGEDFIIAVFLNINVNNNIDTEAETGDVLADAIYKRNRSRRTLKCHIQAKHARRLGVRLLCAALDTGKRQSISHRKHALHRRA